MKPHHPELPLDARTLLSTPKNIELKEVSPGSYYHFGLGSCIVKALDSVNFLGMNKDHVELLVGIDGTPTSKSTPEEFWPILGQLKRVGYSKPFVIGLYWGPSKPDNVNDFLNDFAVEITEMLNHGFNYKDIKVKLNLIGFCCDAPARAYLKCIKCHRIFLL